MKSLKFKKASGVERMYEDGFGGINRAERQGNCFLTENLDLCADGSLKTRAGYADVAEYEGNLRACFNYAGKLYTVIGDKLVVIDTASGISEVKALLQNSEGEADIFCFGGNIYIHDGSSFYLLNSDMLEPVEGYAPLYGKDWYPWAQGPINEDINLLSDRIRISYSIASKANKFYLGVEAASIDRIEIDGNETNIDTVEARIDEEYPFVLHTNTFEGSFTITFWLTLHPNSSQKHRIRQATKAFVFGNNGGERLCLYNPGISSTLYSSKPVKNMEHALSALTAEDALPFYIPLSSALCIGSGESPITDLAQHYGKGLLFTEKDAWCIDWDDQEANASILKPQSYLLNSAIGADHVHSSGYFDNDPITYFCGRLWRWHSQSGVRDECSATMISDAVAELLPKDSENISMLSLPQTQKFFIADAEDIEGRLLVYDLAREAWTMYRGIFAERLFRYGNLPAFSRGGSVYVFREELSEDDDSDENFPIGSRLITHFLDFGCPEKTKRSACVLLEYDLSGGSGVLTFENEKGEKTATLLHGKIGGGREQLSEHIPMPRFKKLRMTLEAKFPAVIYSAIISAK